MTRLIDKKIAVLIGDGMADYPIADLGNKTPLEYAATPHMDRIAREGVLGLVKTIPDGMLPGSDTANLSIFGYNPAEYYTGRAPLEALNLGIELGPRDVAFRCNMVDIDERSTMVDFSARHIETEFSDLIIAELRSAINDASIEFHTGVSYRHIMVWRDFPDRLIPSTVPPHDIQGRPVAPYLPSGNGADALRAIMHTGSDIIRNSRLIRDARDRYQGNPTGIWLWGGGKKPQMPGMRERYGLYGYTISAVDLIHGIGRALGLEPLRVPGATGYIDTNYTGKAEALLEGLRRSNFVFLHVESPDESGHEGNLEHKIRSIQDFDSLVVGRVLEGIPSFDDYSLLVMPDHATPISLRTHSSDPVPFAMIHSSGAGASGGGGFNESAAASSGVYVDAGHRLLHCVCAEKIEGR